MVFASNSHQSLSARPVVSFALRQPYTLVPPRLDLPPSSALSKSLVITILQKDSAELKAQLFRKRKLNSANRPRALLPTDTEYFGHSIATKQASLMSTPLPATQPPKPPSYTGALPLLSENYVAAFLFLTFIHMCSTILLSTEIFLLPLQTSNICMHSHTTHRFIYRLVQIQVSFCFIFMCTSF